MNLLDDEAWLERTWPPERPGYVWRRKRVAGEHLGAGLIELPPGEKAILSMQMPAEFVIVFEPVTHAAKFLDVKGEPTRERQNVSIVFNKIRAPTPGTPGWPWGRLGIPATRAGARPPPRRRLEPGSGGIAGPRSLGRP
jgi:hypothetical protein